jgi:hypothetical protein
MVILIKENFKMVKHMVREFIHGLMVKSMMENGRMDLRMDMAFGKE